MLSKLFSSKTTPSPSILKSILYNSQDIGLSYLSNILTKLVIILHPDDKILDHNLISKIEGSSGSKSITFITLSQALSIISIL